MIINLLGGIIYELLYVFFWQLYFQTLGRGKVTGMLPDYSFILIANHVSYFDWLLLDALIYRQTGRKIKFVAKEKLLNNPLWRLLIHYRQNTVIVSGSGRKETIEMISNCIKAGDILAIFPEATRAPSEKLLKFHKGFSYLALKHNVPVVPIGLRGFFENWPRHRLLPKLQAVPMEIRIGEPLNMYRSDDHQNGIMTIESLVNESRQRIQDLLAA